MLDLKALSGLRPISHTKREESDSGIRADFKITVDPVTHRPKLKADFRPETVSLLPECDRRVIREVKRILNDPFAVTQDSFGFGKDAKKPNAVTVDIWDNPGLIPLLIGNDRLTDDKGNLITMQEEMPPIMLSLLKSDKSSDYTPILAAMPDDGRPHIHPTFLSEDMILSEDKIYNIAPVGENFQTIYELVQNFESPFLEQYLSLFLSYFNNIKVNVNGREVRFTNSVEKAVPTIILEKVAPDRALYLRVTQSLESASEELASDFPLTRAVSVDEKGEIIVRNVEYSPIEKETGRLAELVLSSAPDRKAKKDVYIDRNFFIIPAETASPFLISHLNEVLESFRLLGSDKLKEYKITTAFPKLKLRLSSGIDFLEGDADVEISGETFTLSDLLSQFRKKKYVTLSDGNRALIDRKYISRLQRLFERRDADGHIKVSFFDLPEVEQLIDSKISGQFATKARKVYEGFNTIKPATQKSVKVDATLRPYQRDGVAWLRYLAKNDLGGCLADDMGLGKTLQAISLLADFHPGAERPSLVVMPRSLLFNWEAELAKFAPQIRVATYYGPERDLDKCLEADVVLTTYAVTRNDIETLKDRKFNSVILDESQNIKNVTSQTSRAVALLDAGHRFALSGTPMENNLVEIYSLFRFLNPTMFGKIEQFNALYTNPIQRDGDMEALSALSRKIYPYMLRRLKKDVLTELPDRIEQTIYVEMSEAQKKLYETRRIAYKNEIEQTISTEGVEKAQFVMFQALAELRRIASVPESLSDNRVTSPKIDELMDSLTSAVQNGHKCVVFFNYIAGIELVADRLERIGIRSETMTGSSSATARKKIVSKFQSDPDCKVLLMTLKVGGVGLNLTAADTVYIFEPWWNKAAEEQAINRLHRIGQKATVNAFSIIAVGTIEEKIQLLQQKKAELFDRLISADSSSSKRLSKEDIDFILS